MVEEYSSTTGVQSRLFKLDVVGAELLLLEDVVDSVLVESRLVMRKGVEFNSSVVGFKLIVVLEAIISVDANSVVVVDPRDMVVVSKMFGVVEEYSSSTRCGVVPRLFMFVLDVEVVESILVIRSRGVGVDFTVFKRCGVIEEYISSTRFKGVDPWLLTLDVVVSRLLM